jgi:hypothetical protein
MDFLITKTSLQVRKFAPWVICKLNNKFISQQKKTFLYLVFCFFSKGRNFYIMLNNVGFVIWKFSTKWSSSNSVRKNLKNQIILLHFTQWPKSSNKRFNACIIWYSCKAVNNNTYFNFSAYCAFMKLLNSKNVDLIRCASTMFFTSCQPIA